MDVQDLVVISTYSKYGKQLYTHKDIKGKLSDDKTILRLFRRLEGGKVIGVDRKSIEVKQGRNHRNSHYFYDFINVEALLLLPTGGTIHFRCVILDFENFIKKF